MKTRRVDPNDELIERVLRDRARSPDAFLLDEILRVADATPQVRPRLGWITGRWILAPISPVLIVILLGAALLAAAAIGAALIRPPVDRNLSVDVPAEFQYVWIGDNRSVPALGDDERLSSIFGFGPEPNAREPVPIRLSFFGELPSRVTVTGERMRVVITADGAGCQAGDIGTYRWSLSEAGDELRLDLVEDGCATRAAALPGTWTRSDCPLFPDDFCLGDLEPGTHRSTFFDPFATLDEWLYNRGVLTYTVPAGWANTGDYPDIYVLAPVSAAPDTGIYMSSEISVVSDDRPCTATPSATVARTPDEMADWIVGRPGIIASGRDDVNIGGLPGVMLDLAPDAGLDRAVEACIGDGHTFVPLFTGAQPGGLQWGLLTTQRMRVYLLDLGDDRTLVVLIEGETGPTYENLLAEAVPILESFRFNGSE